MGTIGLSLIIKVLPAPPDAFASNVDVDLLVEKLFVVGVKVVEVVVVVVGLVVVNRVVVDRFVVDDNCVEMLKVYCPRLP